MCDPCYGCREHVNGTYSCDPCPRGYKEPEVCAHAKPFPFCRECHTNPKE